MTATRLRWNSKSHEAGVERFYNTGVKKYGNFHNGYLNFGLWEKGITDYLSAAENLVRHVGNMIGLTKESRLLDVACGMGTQDIFLHKIFGCRIDALDVTWEHTQYAKQRVSEAQFSNAITVHHGTGTKPPFRDNTFTHLACIEGAEFFNTREDFFKEAYRVLKPGGVMGLCDYNLHRQPRNPWEHFLVEAARVLWHVPRANYDTAESYKMKLERNGFRNVSIKEAGELTIPGYYFETKRTETRAAMRRIRGLKGLYGGMLIDYALYRAFRAGLINYILVRADK